MKLCLILCGLVCLEIFSTNNRQSNNKPLSDSILGKWCAVDNPEYNSLTFSENGMVVVDPWVDTIYRFNDTITSSGYLMLKSFDGKEFLSKIEKLSRGSLILEKHPKYKTMYNVLNKRV